MKIDHGTIAEIPFIRRGDSAYVVVEGRPGKAEANAQKLGGHLVTINDADENQWLTKHVKSLDKSGEWKFWTGLHKEPADNKEGQFNWKWSSNELSDFRLWHQGHERWVNDRTNYSFINLPQSNVDYKNNVGVWVPSSNDHYYDYGKGDTYAKWDSRNQIGL